MSKIDVKLVATIRKATGAALHTCKHALEEAAGNAEAAIEKVKAMGYALAAKKSDRATSEGCIVGQIYQLSEGIYQGGLLECQSETDFVGTNENFVNFAQQVLEVGLKANVRTLDALLSLPFDHEQTVEQARQTLIGKVSENVRICRYQCLETKDDLGLYVHKGRYGSIVAVKGANPSIAKEIAVHVVVSHPSDISELLKQEFYKDPSKTVEQYLKDHQCEVLEYIYYALGDSS